MRDVTSREKVTSRKIPDGMSTPARKAPPVRKILAKRLEERLDDYPDLDELAKRLGCHRTLLDHWRAGRRAPVRDLDQLVQLADALGVSIDWLFGRDAAPPPPPLRQAIDHEALQEAVTHARALIAALEGLQRAEGQR